MPTSRDTHSDSRSNFTPPAGSIHNIAPLLRNVVSYFRNRTRPRRRRYRSAFEEESDNSAPPLNSRRLHFAQTFENNTDEQPSRRNSGTQGHTDDSMQAEEGDRTFQSIPGMYFQANDDEDRCIIPRRQRNQSASKEESDSSPALMNSRLDLAQIVQSNTGEHSSQTYSGTQRNTEGSSQTTDSNYHSHLNSRPYFPLTNENEGLRIIPIFHTTDSSNQRDPRIPRSNHHSDLNSGPNFPSANDDEGLRIIPIFHTTDSLNQTDPRISRNSDNQLNEENTISILRGEEIVREITAVLNAMRDDGLLTAFEEPEEQFNTGLSDEEVKVIPITCITKQHVEDQNNCTICCTDYHEGEVVNKLPCNHLYHKVCIATWLRSNGTCPNCRKNLNTQK